MNYREVKCSDRLPEKEGVYFVYYNKTVDGYIKGHEYFNPDKGKTVAFWRNNYHIWLESYNPPTEEDIQDEVWQICSNLNDNYIGTDTGAVQIAEAIANLLKGDKKKGND